MRVLFKGVPFLGYTVLWNDFLNLPMGYDASTNTYHKEKVGYSARAIPTGIYLSFTAFRNLKEMSLSIQDEDGNTFTTITKFSEFTEDGSPCSFKKNIMSYGDNNYKFDSVFWSGKDDKGNTLPNESPLNYEGAEP
ncbi:hypothetical protein [Bacillus pakistanensis]|nr:hypothetical protein [Bacillus pakistanensis]